MIKNIWIKYLNMRTEDVNTIMDFVNGEYKRVWVTGGTGLVGHGILSAITQLGAKSSTKCTVVLPDDVCIYDEYTVGNTGWIFTDRHVDLTRMKHVHAALKYICPDIVIHLAAFVGGLYKNIGDNINMYEKNVAINYNVLKACNDHGIQTVISCLSTCIFPDERKKEAKQANYVYEPLTENTLHDGEPHDSNFGYAYAKRMLEVQSRIYNQSGRNYICIIPTNIYGHHDNFDLEDGHVIPALIHQCFLAQRDEKPFVIRGSGCALRQFLLSDDLGEIILLLLARQHTFTHKSIIISPDTTDEMTIRELADDIADAFQYDNIIFDATYSDGQYRKTADNSLLRQIIGEYEFTPLAIGIKRTVDWFIANYPENIRGGDNRVLEGYNSTYVGVKRTLR